MRTPRIQMKRSGNEKIGAKHNRKKKKIHQWSGKTRLLPLGGGKSKIEGRGEGKKATRGSEKILRQNRGPKKIVHGRMVALRELWTRNLLDLLSGGTRYSRENEKSYLSFILKGEGVP